MAQTPKKVSDLYLKEQDKNFLRPEYMSATSGTPTTGQFYSDIQNRADMIDLSQDLGVRFGPNRIHTHEIFEIQDEVGPNGEKVFGVVNDKFGQVRFVGSTNLFSNNATTGVGINLGNEDYAEITFYGTGINVLAQTNSSATNIEVYVDGVLDSTVDFGNKSIVLSARNYSPNVNINAIKGLTLGIHTIKLKKISGGSANVKLNGFEILNERTDLLVPKGNYFKDGKVQRLLTEQNVAYESDFENEYGTPGTKGGHVSLYLTEDGKIKKDIQYTDVTPQYLTSADHSNEEIIARHNFREFGCGRADDFSTLVGAVANKAFTLSDGTTTLVANDVDINTGETSLRLNTSGSFFTFTFVGTGLDITTEFNSNANANTVTVDGVVVASGTGSISGTGKVKICSGLSYGTHTVKVERTDNNGSPVRLDDLIVYGPKKPEIEESAVELASYFLMADFVANTTADVEELSQGTLRKQGTREWAYIGAGWVINPVNPTLITGFQIDSTSGNNHSASHSGFCIGFDFRFDSFVIGAQIEVTLNGTLLTAANFPSATFSNYGGTTSFNDSTGILSVASGSGTIRACGFTVEGLDLDSYEVKFRSTTASSFAPVCIDYITPIHTPKLNGPFVLQNTLRVGSTSIGDKRELASYDDKLAIRADGTLTSPSTGTTQALVPDMNVVLHKKKAGKVLINFSGGFSNVSAGNNSLFYIYINGKLTPAEILVTAPAGSYVYDVTLTHTVYLEEGTYNINVQYRGTAGTLSANGIRRSLNVTEV